MMNDMLDVMAIISAASSGIVPFAGIVTPVPVLASAVEPLGRGAEMSGTSVEIVSAQIISGAPPFAPVVVIDAFEVPPGFVFASSVVTEIVAPPADVIRSERVVPPPSILSAVASIMAPSLAVEAEEVVVSPAAAIKSERVVASPSAAVNPEEIVVARDGQGVVPRPPKRIVAAEGRRAPGQEGEKRHH